MSTTSRTSMVTGRGLLRVVHAGVALEPFVFECIRWIAVVASTATVAVAVGGEGWIVGASGHGAVIATVCVVAMAIVVGIRVIASAVLCRDEVEALEVGIIFAVVCGTARLQP